MGNKRGLEKNNTMKAVRFLKLQIISAVIGTLLYLIIPGLFRPVWGKGYVASVLLFVVFVFVCDSVGVIFSIYNERNGISVFRNSVIPLGVYTVFTYYRDRQGAIVALIIILGLMSAFLVIECRRGNRDNEKTDRSLFPNGSRVAIWVWNLVGLGLVALMLVFAYDGVVEWLRRLTG